MVPHESHEEYMNRRIKEEYAERRINTDGGVDPAHYNQHAIEPITYIMANGLDFCEGNVVKYVSRWRAKGGVGDLKKARQYLDFIIKQQEEGAPL